MDAFSGGGFGPTVQLNDGTLLTADSYAGKDLSPTDLRIEVVRWRLTSDKPRDGEDAP